MQPTTTKQTCRGDNAVKLYDGDDTVSLSNV